MAHVSIVLVAAAAEEEEEEEVVEERFAARTRISASALVSA